MYFLLAVSSYLSFASALSVLHPPIAARQDVPARLVSPAALRARSGGSCTFYGINFMIQNRNQAFTALSGVMHPPETVSTNGGYPYLWPGLQPVDGAGVLQNVLDTEHAVWNASSGWCCANPAETFGEQIAPRGGQALSFRNTLNGDNWDTEFGVAGGGASTSFPVPVGYHAMNQVVFAIELWSPATWNFGALSFSNISITSTGTDASWCSNRVVTMVQEPTQYTMSGPQYYVDQNKGTVTCEINELTLVGPLGG